MAAFDQKARVYLTPFYVTHIAVGVRAFSDAAKLPDHQVCKHPEDFTLYHLGSFNDETADYSPFAHPINLGTALNYLTVNPLTHGVMGHAESKKS